jgi:hypothetical protein
MARMSELAQLLDEPTAVEIAGQKLALRPMRFGQLARALALAGPIAQHLASGRADLFALLSSDGERLIELAALLSGQSRAWIESLPPDEAVRLIGALYEVNRDFFSRRLAPALTQTLAKINGSTGASPSASAPTQAASGANSPDS